MKGLAVVVAAFAALALSPGTPAASRLSGKYRGQITTGFLKGTWRMTFNRSRLTYKVTGPFGSLTGHNKYNGSQITFYKESEGTICPGAGVYRYKLTGSRLKFTKVREACSPRAIVTARPTYRRVG
jgi:hypothetical protein